MAGAAIGGGEWLTGPVITARYGGGLLWLATLSILGQTFYNVEVSRYTLYTGEPIFAGKFRMLPGPVFWMVVYLMFDIYMFFPYLAASASVPLLAILRGEIPDPTNNPSDEMLVRTTSIAIFVLSMVPLLVGGKVYNSIKFLMTAKIVGVMGFLLILALMFSNVDTWKEITSGFFKFGNLPVNNKVNANDDGASDIAEDQANKLALEGTTDSEHNDVKLDNVFVAFFEGRPFPEIDFSIIGFLCALVAISGNGGLGNSAVSNYTREQGWGMGTHVGASDT